MDSVIVSGSCKVLVKQDDSVYLRPPFAIGVPFHLSVEETMAGNLVMVSSNNQQPSSHNKSAQIISSDAPTVVGRGHPLLSWLPPQSLSVVSRQHCTLQIHHSDIWGKLVKLTSHSRNGTIVMIPTSFDSNSSSLLILKRDSNYLMSPRVTANEYYQVVFTTVANSAVVCLYHPPATPVIELPFSHQQQLLDWQQSYHSSKHTQRKEQSVIKSC